MRKRLLLCLCLGLLCKPAWALVEIDVAPSAWPPEEEGSSLVAPAWAQSASEAIFAERGWLQDLYAWKEAYKAGQKAPAEEAGAYCIGNGRAFAMLGPGGALWNWSSLYGAAYVTPDLGGMSMSLADEDGDLNLASRSIGWVRRSGVVRSKADGAGVSVEAFDFAPVAPKKPGDWDNPPVLVRVLRVKNNGSRAQPKLQLTLKLQPAWGLEHQMSPGSKDLFLDQASAQGKKRTYWRLGAFDQRRASASKYRVSYELPELKPGQEEWAAFFLLATESPEENAAIAADLRAQGPLTLLDQTRSFFQGWFEAGVQFSGDAKLADLFEVSSVIFKCQQSHSGGFSPLIGYAYTWIRDNNGPIRWFLKTGQLSEARGPMDFFYESAHAKGYLFNSVRVDAKHGPRRRDLARMGVEHAETPNWVVLQHVWYAQATGDLPYLRKRWDYLQRCIFGQLNIDDKYFFERDETYLWCLEGRIFDFVPFPNHFLSTFAFTSDSSFELVAAADHLAWVARALGKEKDADALSALADRVRAKTLEAYWQADGSFWSPGLSLLGPAYKAPFANILLNPFWVAYARNDLDPVGETREDNSRSLDALRTGYRSLGLEDGSWKTTPSVDYFVGMNPGQLLYSLSKARSPWAGSAFDWTLRTASPSGDYAEMYDGRNRPWNQPGLGQGTRGRVRPWEGGLNVDAIFEFLTGFAPDAMNKRVVFAPHLPDGRDAFSAKRLAVGATKVSLSMKRENDERWTVDLTHEEGAAIDVVMDFWPDHRTFASVQASSSVDWSLRPAGTSGRQARCSFKLEPGQAVSFAVDQSSALPARELKPPVPETYKPKTYEVPAGDLLLITSPSALLNRKGYRAVSAAKILPVGGGELRTVKSVTSASAFLDLDLPIDPSDVAAAILTKDKKPRFKLLVLGRGAFSPGRHTFKPAAFWDDPKLVQAFKIFLQEGGSVYLGPSFPGREVIPDWLERLTWGWSETETAGQAVALQGAKSSQRALDSIMVGDLASEQAHGVQVSEPVGLEALSLPDGNSGKTVSFSARTFKGAYEFKLRTQPGSVNRIYFRVDTGRNIKGSSLAIERDGSWVPLGIRTKAGAEPRQFQFLAIEVPAALVSADVSKFRLSSRGGEEINVCSLHSYVLIDARDPALAKALGFKSAAPIGEVAHGLVPGAKNWAAPLVLAEKKEEAALIFCRVGKGFLFRSELSLPDAEVLFKTLLKPGTVDRLRALVPN